jgi:hypothetical protein
MKDSQKGFILPLLLVIIAILLIGGGTYVYTQNKRRNQSVVESPTTQTIATNSATSTTISNSVRENIPILSTGKPSDISKDTNHVYDSGYPGYDSVFANAEPKTFAVLNEYYGKDVKNVYWLIEGEEGPIPHQISGADAQSFTVFPSPHDLAAKDRNYIYENGYPITEVTFDPSTFSFIATSSDAIYVKDKNGVYELTFRSYGNFKYEKVTGADPNSFILLSSISKDDYYRAYARDAAHVFFATTTIVGADLNSFHSVLANDGYDAQDRNHKYLKGQVVQ